MKRLLLALLLLFTPLAVQAQNPTAVSGTITDPNAVAYYPATVTACLTPVTTDPIVNGQHVNQQIGSNYCAPLANTSPTGFFSLSLFPNSAITPAATQWRFTVTALGAAPPAGKGSQTFQSSITISGTSQDVGATLTAASIALLNSSGGITSVSSLPATCTPGTTAPVNLSVPPYGIFYCSATNTWSSSADVLKGVTCVGCKADAQFVNDATISNGSANVTTSGGDIAFTSADSTKACFATSGGGPATAHIAGKLSMAQGTFTQTGAHTGTCTVANANATGAANNYFFWATNDAAALATWWTTLNPSGAMCKTGLLPATAFFTDTNFGSAAAPVCKTAITGAGNEGISIQGFGQLDSLMIIGPAFDPTTCTGGGGGVCLFGGVGISLSNFGIYGGERGDCPSTFNGKGLLGFNTDTHIFNLTAAGWCAGSGSTSNGLVATGAGSAAQQYGIIIDGFGNTCYTVTVSYIPIANSWFGDCSSGVVVGATFPSTGNTFGDVATNSNAVIVNSGGIFQSVGDSCFNGTGGNMAGVKVTSGGIANLDNLRCDVSLATTSVALWLNGGTANITMSRLKGGSGTGNDVLIDSSGTINVGIGNAFIQGVGHFTVTAGAGTIIADGHSLAGACTGVATAASTLGLYNTGPNETLTTCTSTTIGTGVVVNSARTLQNLVVTTSAAGTNGSSGLVTVLVNGAGSTIVCTVGTGTSCVDNTHQVALVAGDRISFQFTSQAADTLAGVKAFVMWN